MNPFLNKDENRLRAFFRVLLFMILFSMVGGLQLLGGGSGMGYLLVAIGTWGLYLMMIRFVDQRAPDESGLQFDGLWFKDLLAGILMAAAVMSIIFLGLMGAGGLEVTGFAWEQVSGFWAGPLLIFLVQMISVGFYEEIMARGYILRNAAEGLRFGPVSARQSVWLAVLVSSSLFGLMHGFNPNVTGLAIANIVLAGVMLAIPFIMTGSLALSVGIHLSWNFFQGGVFGFNVSGLSVRNTLIHIQQTGDPLWTGGPFGPEGGLSGLLGILLLTALILLYLKMTGREWTTEASFLQKFTERMQNSSS